ncbi:MAG: AIPR protein [bacterium ADurb.Bin236]|nr:MAG: AIPR protein [bacterium ADurb.Bin236]
MEPNCHTGDCVAFLRCKAPDGGSFQNLAIGPENGENKMSDSSHGIKKVILKSDYTRKFPDPLNEQLYGGKYNIEHLILMSKAIDIPADIPMDANVRVQNINKVVYREVRKSLDDDNDLTFHLKNKGITILAQKVEFIHDKKVAEVTFIEGDGIVDGGHTHRVITEAIKAGTCPQNQYVKIEIITGVPNGLRVEIASGLNTTVKVEQKSLANHEGKFNWIKETLQGESYASRIAYRENEDGDCDIRDIIALLNIFNVDVYKDAEHPVKAYTSKAECLKTYLSDYESESRTFEKLKPLLRDILELHDYIHVKARERYNEVYGGRAGAMVGLYTEPRRNRYHLLFMNKDVDRIMYDGVLYPILGAMRYLVHQKPDENVFSWKLGSFDRVKIFFDEIAPEMVALTYNLSKNYGLKPNPVGKDIGHWNGLYRTVGMHFLEKHHGS